MTLTGNYWLDLLTKEKKIRKEIEVIIQKSIGRTFSDYESMTSRLKDDIRTQLENYGVKHHMGLFHIEYDLDLKYDDNYTLTNFNIKYVFLDEDIW